MESGGMLLKDPKMCEMLFWGHSLIIIKWDWGKSFPKMKKWKSNLF